MARLTFQRLLAFSMLAFALTCARAAIPTGTTDELLQQLKKDVPDVLDCRPEHGLPFDAQEIHLAVDGSPQYLLTSKSDCMCGQVNCNEWVYRRGPQKWELILETQGYRFNARAAVHHGYRDVETLSRDNAARVDILAYVFDGHAYRAAPTRQLDLQAAATGRTHQVQFAPGTSSIRLQGSVSSGAIESWTVGARKAQTLRLSLVDPEKSGIRFTVRGPPGFNGQSLPASDSRAEVTLPKTGTYTIHVQSTREALSTYTLVIEIR